MCVTYVCTRRANDFVYPSRRMNKGTFRARIAQDFPVRSYLTPITRGFSLVEKKAPLFAKQHDPRRHGLLGELRSRSASVRRTSASSRRRCFCKQRRRIFDPFFSRRGQIRE